MYNIDKDKQMEVLRWLMYAWDGQWLGRTTAVYGPAEASKLNARVRAAFAKVEMKGLLALLGKKQAENLSDAAEMLKAYFQLVFGERGFQGKFAPVEAVAGGGARLQVQVSKMTALESLKKVAQAANEPPAAICELLWTNWLEGLLPDAQLHVTSRSQNGVEIYQIDSLSETFTAATADLFDVPMPEDLMAQPATATPHSNHQWTGRETVFGENKNQPDVVPTTPKNNSPIADVLQIPMEQIKPTITPNPYGGGRVSFSPGPGALASGSTPLAQPAPGTMPGSNSALPQPPFGAPPASSPGLPQPPFGAPQQAAPPASNPGLPQPPFGAPPPAPTWPGSPEIGRTEISQQRASSLTESNFAPPPGPVAGIGLTVDGSGRPLFSTDLDEEARMKALKSKSKSLPGFSRMFMSKEAKDTFAKTAEEPVAQLTSVAMNVDVVLQNKLNQVRAANPGLFRENIRVVGGPEGELNIVVGQLVYKRVDDIPPGPIQDIIRQAVAEWSESNF